MKLNRCIMWMVLFAIELLTILSVLGAFCGAQKAKLFFNSFPLGFYWYGLAVLLLAGLVEFPRLLRKPGLLMIHVGCLLVLIGGMWGSEAGHRLSKRFFGTQKIPSGYMFITEGDSENYVTTENLRQRLGKLPFSLKLNDFSIEYYKTNKDTIPRLDIQTSKGLHFQITAEPGEELFLGPDEGKLRVIQAFKNFKILLRDGEKIVTDEVGKGENPALEVMIETPDGNSQTRYVFEYFAGFDQGKNELKLIYKSQPLSIIRDYFSDVTVLKEGKEVLRKTIEVNHPLHYGGYHFYQHSYDSAAGKYTILSVTSDSGLYIVYIGYWMLCIGVVLWFWLRHIIDYIINKKTR